MSNTSWTPSEPSDVLFSEKTWLQGAILTGVGYGIVFTLFTQCLRALLLNINRENRKQRIFFLVYISILFILGTLFMAACAQMTQLSFVQYRNYPTGPSGYENDEFSIPVDELGNVSFVLTNWFADALLVCMQCSSAIRYIALMTYCNRSGDVQSSTEGLGHQSGYHCCYQSWYISRSWVCIFPVPLESILILLQQRGSCGLYRSLHQHHRLSRPVRPARSIGQCRTSASLCHSMSS